MKPGFIVLESGEVFAGTWLGGEPKAGEIVFNTSHSGYEEIATDPSYFNQIMVMTTSQLGNYGDRDEFWESESIHINGFVCLEIQNSYRDTSWLDKLTKAGVPVITELDTRSLVLNLREHGTVWGAAVNASSKDEAVKMARPLIEKAKSVEKDWCYITSAREAYSEAGVKLDGPAVAVLDLGCKKNIVRELKRRCREVRVFPSRTNIDEIKSYSPDGILLSNGPGDPADVEVAVDTIKGLIGWRPIFGICMGHHLLGRALGGSTYKLKFGHRGSNHPVKDDLLGRIYITSQNHGYAIEQSSLPADVKVTHMNLNDNTVSGIQCEAKKCFSVQFHPESHPGPHDAEVLFDYFIKQIL